MFSFAEALPLLFAWLPAWFSVAVLIFVAFCVLILAFKLVAFVLDVLPFA